MNIAAVLGALIGAIIAITLTTVLVTWVAYDTVQWLRDHDTKVDTRHAAKAAAKITR